MSLLRRVCGATRALADAEEDAMEKCAHPACQCMVEKGGEYGKYCSEHCREAGDVIELRCDCRHPPCR